MITIRPGSHVHTLLSILPFVGEYPMSALRLLGSVRSYKDLIYKLTYVQEFRFPDSDERFTCRLLNVCGRGNRKTVRFHKRDRKSTRLNSSHVRTSRMPSSA